MTRILAAFAGFLLMPSIAVSQDVQQSAVAECTTDGLDMSLPGWKERMLSVGSFRLAIDPDTSRGPTTAVILDSGKIQDPANPANEPFFVATVGDEGQACTVRMPFAQCPSAQVIAEKLKAASLPLGFGLDKPTGVLMLHGPTYYVEFVDGLGNRNQWVFNGAGHPLQELVESSIAGLGACLQSANDAYQGL